MGNAENDSFINRNINESLKSSILWQYIELFSQKVALCYIAHKYCY